VILIEKIGLLQTYRKGLVVIIDLSAFLLRTIYQIGKRIDERIKSTIVLGHAVTRLSIRSYLLICLIPIIDKTYICQRDFSSNKRPLPAATLGRHN